MKTDLLKDSRISDGLKNKEETMTVLGLQEDGDAHLRILNHCCSWTLRQPFSLISRLHSSCKLLKLHHHEIWRPYREETIRESHTWTEMGQHTAIFRVQRGACCQPQDTPLKSGPLSQWWGPEKLTRGRLTGGKKASFIHTHVSLFR